MIVTNMDAEAEKTYKDIRSDRAGFYEQQRGLIAVWGKEAVQFLDGMITNDLKTLDDGAQMLAAFPNAQGRLLALVRVQRQGDRFLFDTEESTRPTLFQNLHRFTLAGDFFVEDWSDTYRFFEVYGSDKLDSKGVLQFAHARGRGLTYAVPHNEYAGFCAAITDQDFGELNDEQHDVFRIEAGIPKYGVDMDETTVVPELGLDGLISYSKGCYIGQEIIARIHFRGHIAKQLTGILFEPREAASNGPGEELTSADGKPAGKITSSTHSPKLNKTIALAFVRYDYLTPGTELTAGDAAAVVTQLPFLE